MKQLIPKQSAAITAGLSFLAALLLVLCFGRTSEPVQAAPADITPTFFHQRICEQNACSQILLVF